LAKYNFIQRVQQIQKWTCTNIIFYLSHTQNKDWFMCLHRSSANATFNVSVHYVCCLSPRWVRIATGTSDFLMLESYSASLRNVGSSTQVPVRVRNNARKCTWSLSLTLKLERPHITNTASVWRKPNHACITQMTFSSTCNTIFMEM
jgi:hypothetical protein